MGTVSVEGGVVEAVVRRVGGSVSVEGEGVEEVVRREGGAVSVVDGVGGREDESGSLLCHWNMTCPGKNGHLHPCQTRHGQLLRRDR
jgi:hypothetical protein